jgi:hypothetical protein
MIGPRSLSICKDVEEFEKRKPQITFNFSHANWDSVRE